MAGPYDVPNNGTVEYELARQATAPRGIMGLANTSIGQAPPPTNAAVIGAIANSPPSSGYVPPSYQAYMNRPSVADQLFGPAYGRPVGGPPPMGGPVRPVMGIPIGPQPYRHGMWADRTMHIGYDPNTGQMSATHLTGFNSPYPYVVRGGPVPVGSFSAPLMASILSGIQIGPRNGYAPVAPRMGGGPAVGGGPGGNAQKTTEENKTEEKPGTTETPPGAEKTTVNVPLKTLMHPEQDAQWYNERGDPNEDYRVDLGDRIRYTARQEGMKDWQTADEADLARRLQANGYVIRDVRGPAAVSGLSNLEASRDVYNAPNRDVNSDEFRQALTSGQDLYTMYRQQGYSHADASNMVTQSLHAQYQNRLLDRSIDEYLREQDPASFTTSGVSPTVGPNQVVGYYANPQNVMRDRRNIY